MSRLTSMMMAIAAAVAIVSCAQREPEALLWLSGGAPAVEAYRKFLSSGCSDPPVELLKIAGVDMSTPQPVNEALALFDQLLTEMEQLLAE